MRVTVGGFGRAVNPAAREILSAGFFRDEYRERKPRPNRRPLPSLGARHRLPSRRKRSSPCIAKSRKLRWRPACDRARVHPLRERCNSAWRRLTRFVSFAQNPLCEPFLPFRQRWWRFRTGHLLLARAPGLHRLDWNTPTARQGSHPSIERLGRIKRLAPAAAPGDRRSSDGS